MKIKTHDVIDIPQFIIFMELVVLDIVSQYELNEWIWIGNEIP